MTNAQTQTVVASLNRQQEMIVMTSLNGGAQGKEK